MFTENDDTLSVLVTTTVFHLSLIAIGCSIYHWCIA
ncbi:hypothetical protein IE1_05604 [Bacillus cereus BAG3O-2]|nr:hypothetical protein IE1_05604 [Bacillus cereus BAG3O-2]